MRQESKSCASAPRWVWTFRWMAVLGGFEESTPSDDVPLWCWGPANSLSFRNSSGDGRAGLSLQIFGIRVSQGRKMEMLAVENISFFFLALDKTRVEEEVGP